MNTQSRWSFVRRPSLLLLLLLSLAELRAMSNFPNESSIESPIAPRFGQPSFALVETERFGSEVGSPTDLEEEEILARNFAQPRSFSGPTELQIALARKLILLEGKDGDSTPTNLQKMELDMAPLDSSSSFSFRLTNSSFLETIQHRDIFNSFSKLRKAVDDEHVKEGKDELSIDYKNDAVINKTKSQSSVNDLIEKDKRLLAEMFSKKIGFPFRTAQRELVAMQGKRSDDGESQGSGLCRSLRERLLEDLVSSYSDPFTARIRYRLKRKPSVYTTRIPKHRNDIGIPDIYETEVTVMPHKALNLSENSSSSPMVSHDPPVTPSTAGHLQILSPRRPPLSLGAIKQRAREQSEASGSVKRRTKGANKSKSLNGGRENQAAIRRYLSRRGYRHPSRLQTRTHLDYRRPVAFKFRRTNDLRKHTKHKILHSDFPTETLPVHPPQEKQQKVETLSSSLLPRGTLPSKTTLKHEKEPPTHKPEVFKHESEEAHSKSSAQNKNFKSYPEHHNAENPYSYEAPRAATETSVFSESVAPHLDSHESHGKRNKYKVPNPHHDYETSPLHQLSPKSAPVPGWLMDLKEVKRNQTSPPNYQPQGRSKPKQPVMSSPMPADYALKASYPSALPTTYTTASLKRDLTREQNSKVHVSEDQSKKNATTYSSSSTPDHFRIINPHQEPSHSQLNPPPLNIRIPLKSKVLPSINTGMRADQTSFVPHYPVIPSPDQTSGAKYSVKVTTPSGIYATPVDISSPPPHYGEQSRSIYAPPISPKSTYGSPDDASYQPVIPVKPHLNVNSHLYKAHTSAMGQRDPSINISSHPTVTHLTPIKHQFIEHQVSRYNSTSHRVVVTPKTYHVTVTPKYPRTSAVSQALNHLSKSYTSNAVVPTTFKQSLPRDHSVQLQKTSNPSKKIPTELSISTSTYPPAVYNPATQLKPRKESSNTDILPEISLVPYILEDYVTGHSYDDDYYDYYDDYFQYFDDLYNYDYLLDVLGVSESRPLLPFHVLPDTFSQGELQNIGYIAGVPGRAGKDYPVLGYIPDTSFGCGLVAEYPGYYADMDAGCQVFHVCHHDGTQDSYLCPNGTIFNQKYFVCDWWYNFNCEDAPFFYPVNAALSYAPLTLHDSRSYYDVPSSSLRNTRGNQRPRRGQNRRPTKRRVHPRKAFIQGTRAATRRQHAFASTLHEVALAPHRPRVLSGYRTTFKRSPVPALRLDASVSPFTIRVPNGTLSSLGNARSLSENMPEEAWVSGAYNVTQIHE
ncbi:Chitin binding domain [Trinorchestia longiramus]|nr:Chitin binding domain [Trinorchestia longiramus]